MDFEFTMTRWAFLTSIFCFLSAATSRVVLEFDLWTKKRRLAGCMVFSKMTAVLSLLLSYVNTSLHGWNNLWEMGKDVATVRRFDSIRSKRGIFPFLKNTGERSCNARCVPNPPSKFLTNPMCIVPPLSLRRRRRRRRPPQ